MTDKAREAIERVRDLSKYPAYKHNNLEQWATELEIDSKTLADEVERLELSEIAGREESRLTGIKLKQWAQKIERLEAEVERLSDRL